MKYALGGATIPQDRRKEVNEKILYLVENGKCAAHGVSHQDVFDAYTGDGGLHGLDRSDFANYHAFSSAKREVEQGQFFTPPELCAFLVDCIRPNATEMVADLTAGMGHMLNSLPNLHNAYANEIDLKALRVLRYLFPEAKASADDIRFYEPGVQFDLILGNPPFNLTWRAGEEEYLSQLFYAIKAHELLKPAGFLGLIVPQSFVADEFMDGGMIRAMEQRYRFLYQGALPPDAFSRVGVEHYPTKMMLWQKKSDHLPDNRPYRAEIEAVVPDGETSERIFETVVAPVLAERHAIRAQLYLESNRRLLENKEFHDRVRKLLFDIRRHPRLRGRYAEATALLHRFNTQKRPDGMKYDEWEKTRLKEEGVFAALREIVRSQHPRSTRPGERLVKTGYGLRLDQDGKAVDYKPFYELVQRPYPFDDRTYAKLVRRKQKEFQQQGQAFSEMKSDPGIARFLDELVIHDNAQDREIRLNPTQKADTNLLLQKRYGFLQWEQGSGKSVAATAMLLWRLGRREVRNVIIASTAIAINNTWQEILPSYGIPFRRIRAAADIAAVRPGEVILITVNKLVTYQRIVKRLVRRLGRKAMLILDESDLATSTTSRRTKAVLSCFRRMHYKVLMTGTMTRNSIVEAAPQMVELLYNNSANALSECRYIYRRDKDHPDELVEVLNDQYMRPIPAYQAGYKLFSESHIPERITVFGVGKFSQDIYNAEALKRLLDKTVITRSFEDVTGRKPYTPQQHLVKFNPAEAALYRRIVEEFFHMKGYFTSTGDLRKDRMLEILQQILLMLKACCVPHLFKEYGSLERPAKLERMLELLNDWEGEHVAVGLRHIDSVGAYAAAIQAEYPDRPLFVITGDKVSLERRKQVVAELAATKNGILVSTQQSLSSSVNIGFVNKVIVPELHWNAPAMSQFFFRYIRFDSASADKEVHYLTYEGTIEANLLAMVVAKQRLNLFMQNEELEDEGLMERFGIDFDLLNALMRKEHDENGHVHIRWGQQEIA